MKQKTKKSAAKRFKLTATGKVKFKRAGLRHNLGGKRRKNKVALRKGAYLGARDAWHIEGSLPYGTR